MSEKDGSPRPQGGAGEHISQNYGRLKNMPADELLFEFEAKMDGMTDLDYDGELVDAYLAALDEKAPLDPDLDAEASWNELRTKHADLFEKDATDENGPMTENARKVPMRKLLPKIVALVAVAALFIALCAQAAGFNILGAFGKWTADIFGFSSSDGGAKAEGSVLEATDLNSETYLMIKLALVNCGITEDLAPKWYPEGFEAEPPKVYNTDFYNYIICYFSGENDRHFAIQIIWYDDLSEIEAAAYEKDGSVFEEYVSGNRLFYILSNLDSTSATWSDGEMHTIDIWGDISTDEIKAVIDSIGG